MPSDKLTELNHYRLLGRSGLRVSPLCLGTMTFGTDWEGGADREASRKIFELYVERGGNFIDTANAYTNGTSETYLGEFLESRREKFVLATKYTCNMEQGNPNAGGNHRKNMIQSVEASLKRLKTDYIDLYWLHMWEFRTPIEEVMRALDDLVRVGKVLYLGISDTPAWKVAQGNTIADLRGWTPFIALQVHYNLTDRTSERDLIPMAQELGLGVMPWSPLANGVLTGKYNTDQKPQTGEPCRGDHMTDLVNQRNLAIAAAVQNIAQEIGRSPAQVALNWLLQKPGVVSPILGARKIKQLEDNLGCLEFILTLEQIQHLDSVNQIELGFPHDFLGNPGIQRAISGGITII